MKKARKAIESREVLAKINFTTNHDTMDWTISLQPP